MPIMETLPFEIADKILDHIFHENPRGLYKLRRVSKSWKDMIDRCTARLLKVWCIKCSNEFSERCLDDFVQTRLLQSWQDYCSYKLALPHIARDIYESRNEFPNLDVHTKISITEFFPSRETRGEHITSYAVNDKYFAVCFSSTDEGERVLRIYSLNDLTHCIKDYQLSSAYKLDFFTINNQEFLIIKTHEGESTPDSAVLAEFLVNDDLIPANLPLGNGWQCYMIIKNQCFTLDEYSEISHHRFTQNGFEWNTDLTLPCPNTSGGVVPSNIQICNNNLFVSVTYFERCHSYPSMAVYQYDITRHQPNGEVFFSDPSLYIKMESVVDQQMQLNFGADYIPLPNSICDMEPDKVNNWLWDYFEQYYVCSVTIYAFHLVIMCDEKLIIFRGNFRQLMEYVEKNGDPGTKCTVIDLKSSSTNWLHYANFYLIHIESKPRFLISSKHKVMTVNFSS